MGLPAHLPICHHCGVDDYLIYEFYTAPTQDGPGVVSYTCSACETFAGHEVPAGWAPPGWRVGQ